MSSTPRRLSWILLHFAVIGLALTSLLTGLRIATLSHPELLYFSALLPQGYLHGIHIMSAFGLIAVAVGYLFYRIRFRRYSAALIKRSAYDRWMIRFGHVVMLLSLLSGTLLYFGLSSSLVDLHYFSALALLLFIFLHAGTAFVRYGILLFDTLFRFAKPQWSDAVIVVTTVLLFNLLYLMVNHSEEQTLTLHAIAPETFMEIDGIANESVWSEAQSVTLHTFGAANFTDGRTDVTLKALHNGTEAFFHITWSDPTQSLRHLPLQKTESGWRVIEKGFYRFNEREHYEDKFAVMLSDNCDPGASHTAHLGPKPLKDRPANWHGRGYHYATDGAIRDIWQWKAVRTNDMYTADDNFFGAPDIVRSGNRRYTAGYLPDGKESGAYVMNWQWYSPQGIIPKRLPKNPAELALFQGENNKSDKWVIPWYDYDIYDVKNDNYPSGTIMPSVLYSSNRFEGDRADVRARGSWSNGRWSLELVRRLETGSSLDIVLKEGVCLWVAAFDHAQISHTRHARPLRLDFGDRQ